MTRPIDADILKEAINTWDKFACLPNGKLEPFRNLEHPEMFEPYIHFRDIIKAIDNAPTVEYTFEEAFQKTVCEQRLYCPERPQDEWSLVEHKKNIDLVCPRCGYHRCNLAYGFSIEEVREQIKEDKSNDYLLPDFCERCGTKLGFGGNKE